MRHAQARDQNVSGLGFPSRRCLPLPWLSDPLRPCPPPCLHKRTLNDDVNFLGSSDAAYWQSSSATPVRPAALPSELAQLQHLETLSLDVFGYVPGLPQEWGQPRSFPRLLR